jgi:flagellar basal-body rod protein FlgB
MSDITPISFGMPVDVLSNAMTGASMEHEAVANNIANVNTPNYHRQTVNFKEALAQAQGTPASPDDLALVTNDDRQFAIGAAQPPTPFAPTVEDDTTTAMRTDGSNVDVDQEMAQLSQNSAYGQTMAQLLQVQFTRLREAISEQVV